MHTPLPLVDSTSADPSVLLIESNAEASYEITDLLLQAKDAYDVTAVDCVQEAFQALDERRFDAIVFDAQSAHVRAVAPVLIRLTQRSREVPILVITTHGDERWAVEAMHCGATQVLVRNRSFLPDIARSVGVALERRRMAVRLKVQASRDRLTQLANRSAMSRAVQRSLSVAAQHRTRFAVMLVDLDGFKAINDSLGHAAGDDALRAVARRLRDEVDGCDVVARIGGDEFAVLVSDVGDLWQPLKLAESVLEAVRRPMELAGVPVSLGCRIGIAVYPKSGRTEGALLKAADEAMYAAKGGASAIRLHLPDGLPQWSTPNREPDTPPPNEERVATPKRVA